MKKKKNYQLLNIFFKYKNKKLRHKTKRYLYFFEKFNKRYLFFYFKYFKYFLQNLFQKYLYFIFLKNFFKLIYFYIFYQKFTYKYYYNFNITLNKILFAPIFLFNDSSYKNNFFFQNYLFFKKFNFIDDSLSIFCIYNTLQFTNLKNLFFHKLNLILFFYKLLIYFVVYTTK